jgi:cystathionine beta-lyase
MSDSSSSSSAAGPGKSDKRISALNKALSNVDLDGHDLPPSPAPSSPRGGRQYALATELVYTEGTDQYNASSVPIYQVCEEKRGEPVHLCS